ncbi:hypothetical protein POM88_009614 [Heracleum sosnowskyi]|uniref:Uncharacterized protein n=1 Tax=Heracleum sosnowskyi TaxID=360622 RepID=A0AAD8N8H4_9APIA|nr:hypothetical protein POM88_009614 [Heracleum sosnowskyi]
MAVITLNDVLHRCPCLPYSVPSLYILLKFTRTSDWMLLDVTGDARIDRISLYLSNASKKLILWPRKQMCYRGFPLFQWVCANERTVEDGVRFSKLFFYPICFGLT